MDSLRISDADRQAAVELLSEQYAIGRLSRDEFDERSDAVWSARTRGDLAPVFVDLPVRAPGDDQPQRPPAEQFSLRPRSGFPVRVVAPFLFVLVALTILTHLPFVLIAVALWIVLARWRGGHRAGWHTGRGSCSRY